MPRNFVIVEAGTVEEAVRKGCAALGVTPEDVESRVLEPGSRGFFFSTPCRVKVTVKSERALNARFAGSANRILDDLERAEKALGNRDGSIAFEKDPSGVYLVVQPPSGEGRAVNIDAVYRAVREDPSIINVDTVAVNKAFQPHNYGTRVRIADLLQELSGDRDAVISVTLSSDAMEARVRITPPAGAGAPPSEASLVAALREKGIVAPPDPEALKLLLEHRRYNEEIVVARGTPPEHGEDSSVKWMVGAEAKRGTQVVREDGSVDFRKVYELNNVRAQALLGVLVPATPGKPGRDLLGREIPARPGREKAPRPGKNVRLSPEGDRLYAEIDGQFTRESGVGSVLPVFEVPGDLDLKTGDVDFYGTVMIHGHVLDGFTVKAGGNVFVMGTVGEARIVAGGQVIVGAGFLGKTKGSITAGSDVLLKFAEGGRIEAGENLIADNAVMNCQVRSGGRVEVKAGKGQIVGGHIQARDEVVAKNIGTAVGTKTYITVGVDIVSKERLDRLAAQVKEVEANLDRLVRSRNHLRAQEQRGIPLTREQQELLERLDRAAGGLEGRLEELAAEREAVEAEVAKRRRGAVRSEGSIFPGVHVTIRGVQYHVKDELRASSLLLDGDEVRISPL